ncbi:hypothetical protein CSC74_12800 [Pseudoxanthomonas yeongjuensis]|nr:hypothetical protein CSC74_12800 [Pseudoxanthomonas yeongjuensis]
MPGESVLRLASAPRSRIAEQADDLTETSRDARLRWFAYAPSMIVQDLGRLRFKKFAAAGRKQPRFGAGTMPMRRATLGGGPVQ